MGATKNAGFMLRYDGILGLASFTAVCVALRHRTSPTTSGVSPTSARGGACARRQHPLSVVPPSRLSTVGDRAFPVAAARVWNSLPDFVTASTSLPMFKRHLKTVLFAKSN